MVLCKGADTVLEKLLDPEIYTEDNEIKRKTWEHLINYANIGLRTLLLCKKEISEKEFAVWDKEYKEACSSL